jgi:hypothetical protein
MRVDTLVDQTLDNMSNRPIKGKYKFVLLVVIIILCIMYIIYYYFFLTGTGDWTEFSNVLEVPKDAQKISFGILLSG